MSSVSLDSVSVQFAPGVFGLSGTDLEVADGQFLSLVGPSGSGKTTLLRAIAGFSTPTAGTVSIGGEIVAGPGRFSPPEKRGLGMVFQEHAVWPHWSVGANVEYPLKRSGVARKERRRRVDEALCLVGLDDFGQRRPATLSGGQRQRVALARALVSRPRVLLLDEALSALDEPLRDRLRLELRSLTRELGLTVVHVTHDRQEALGLADRLAVLRAGRIEDIGRPEQMLRAPRTPFVAEFLSDATVVPGRIKAGFFRADDHPLTIECASGSGTVNAAILPGAVRLTPLDSSAAGAHPGPASGPRTPEGPRSAVVRSSLFTDAGSDLVIDWQGLSLRARTLRAWFEVGQRVHVEVDSAIVYPVSDTSTHDTELTVADR